MTKEDRIGEGDLSGAGDFWVVFIYDCCWFHNKCKWDIDGNLSYGF